MVYIGLYARNGSSRRAVLLRFLSVFQREISENPRPIALKLCHMIASVFNLIIPVEKLGAFPDKIWGPKTPKLRSTSDTFKLRTRISPEWIGELWSTNNKVGREFWTHLNRLFFGKPYFGPWGPCGVKFLHALENDQLAC